MIRCKKCGTVNEADATFCSQCNAFLEWSGEKVDGESAPSGGAAASPPASAPTQPAAARPSAPPPQLRGSSTAAVAADEPMSRKPERGQTAPVRKAKPQASSKAEVPQPGDRICPSCGTGNDSERKFCRRCGTALGIAPIAPSPSPQPSRRRSSWLSGVLRRGKQDAYMAGQRPEAMLSSRSRWRPGSSMMVFGLLGVLGLGSIASYYYMPGVGDTVDEVVRTVQNRFVERSPVRATTVQARSQPGFPASDLIDGGGNTYWVGPRNQNDRWFVDFEFQRPSDLLQISFDSGADGEEFERLSRPFKFQLRANGQTTDILELKDSSDQQQVDIDLEGVEELRLIIISQHQGTNGQDDMAIREVSFFGP